ncbi:flagellar basal body-associated FliL family protein [Maridesulfovibrio ferrireducens]|uniref:flagellar basal body-associated FliL family protein n=1 Tax=Maridesulfovibrio ferrireducens TaxID=246191 RepID=UPI001A2B9DEE|nr:flagellar basal body-associated FliL family protein [Maridesulfovibrio ferrireducens]MBI9111526.1 flagellar basal body-associated FliL family protein [Maridesulfovibrio ferrireducens]
MIFLAIDDIDDSEEETQSPETPSKATQKVDLDLDDAPFLEDEDEDDLPDEEPQELEALEEETTKEKSSGSKKFIYLGIGIVILLLSLILVKVFFFSAPPPAEEPAPVVEKVVEIPKVTEAPPPPPEEPGVTLLRMDPFWVEQKDDKGHIRFLVARFAMTTTDERIVGEYGRKTLILRDAVYYYLKNKDLQFLSDKKNAERLKKDLLMVINQYLVAGQFDTILFEKYLVR